MDITVHVTYSEPGSSGSPLLQNVNNVPRVIGMHQGSLESEHTLKQATPISNVVHILNEILEHKHTHINIGVDLQGRMPASAAEASIINS